ncbi:MAG: ArsR/SmtB family transcription factor [Spirochaetia bacterium]
MKQNKEQLITILKALADEKRLGLLQKINTNAYGLNGKMLARHLNLSTSVISRHLKQLKDAGLIDERPLITAILHTISGTGKLKSFPIG